jgi:copper chaperone NosL
VFLFLLFILKTPSPFCNSKKGDTMAVDRRVFIRNLLVGAGILTVFPEDLLAQSRCDVEHPFMPPNAAFKGTCHNCGMTRPMWARTWHSYESNGQPLEVCSLHCLAEASINSGTTPENVQVALYLAPQKSVPAEQAFYVVGSKARGTMTMQSKLAFASKEDAESFAKECSGKAVTFDDAYQLAVTTIEKENEMITRNRISKEKIVEPSDNKDICPVCGMYPARYPKNKCQLQTTDAEVVHFCSTQCLFEFLANPGKYAKNSTEAKFIWVIDFQNGQWIYARSAFYVIGSDLPGPMGNEAFPFASKENATAFIAAHSGEILRFDRVTIERIMT